MASTGKQTSGKAAGNQQSGDLEVLPPVPASPASPADEMQKLQDLILADGSRGQRAELSKDLMTELGKKAPDEKEKIDLLASILDKQQLDAIQKAVAALKNNPEAVDDAKADALQFLRDTVPYLFSVLALRFDVKQTNTIQAFLDLGDRVTDPEEKALLDGVAFLNANPKLETSRYFTSTFVPEILSDSLAMTAAAQDAIEAVKNPGAVSWMSDQMKKHPNVTNALLAAGATGGLFLVGRWLYNKFKGPDNTVKAEKSDDKPGIFSRLTSGWSFLKKTVISALVFGGGLLVAGNVLGIEQVEKYLREHFGKAADFIYDSRISAAAIHFCKGEFEEGLATWNFGSRNEEARRRHGIYAEHFGVPDQAIWMMAGLNFKNFMAAEPGREFPLATGLFASIPFLKDYFKFPNQTKAEDTVINLIKTHADKIHAQIPGADGMTLDEVLKKAFELGLFKPLESAGAKDYSDDLTGLIQQKENQKEDFSKKMKEIGSKEKLSAADLQAIHEAETQVGQGLDEIRLATPTYWTNFMETLCKTFPDLVTDDATIQDIDLVGAPGFYRSFATEASKSDLSVIGKDVAELDLIKKFTATLDTSKPLSINDQALLKKYTDEIARINQSIQDSLVRVKTDRNEKIKEDEARKGVDEFLCDAVDVLKLYGYGYGGMAYGIIWGVQKATGENESIKNRVLGVTAVVGLAPMAANTVYSGYLMFQKGEFLTGFSRLACPPLSYLDVRDVYNGFFRDPGTLLEAVVKGEMKPSRAQRICALALRNENLISRSKAFIGVKWGNRMARFTSLDELLRGDSELRWLDSVFAREITVGSTPAEIGALEDYQRKFVNIIQKETGMSFDKYVEKIAQERGTKRIILETLDKGSFEIGAKMVAFFEATAKKLGQIPIPKPIVEKLFQKGGAGLAYLSYFTKNAARLGMTPAMAYLATYYVCKDTYDARDKSERIALFAIGMIAFEAAWRGINAMKLAPKHPIWMAAAGLLAALGVSVAAEKLAEPYLKNPSFFSVTTRSVLAPAVSVMGLGPLFDSLGHFLVNVTGNTEREYFTKEIYLPFIGSKRMALMDGSIGYFDDLPSEDAIEIWNYQVREKIKKLKAEDEAAVAAGKSGENASDIKALDLKIIDKDWVSREIAAVVVKKAEIAQRGDSLNSDILSKFGASMSPKEKVLVESLLVTDVPESWFDESFYNIEKDERFMLVRKFAHQMDKDAELDTFVERKRQIHSDIDFYRLLKLEPDVMRPKPKAQGESLMAMIGMEPQNADKAESVYNEIFGTSTAGAEAKDDDDKDADVVGGVAAAAVSGAVEVATRVGAAIDAPAEGADAAKMAA